MSIRLISKYIISLCVAFTICQLSYAQITPQDAQRIIRKENIITQEQQKMIDEPREQLRQQQLERIPERIEVIEKPTKHKKHKDKIICFPIKRIILEGADHLSKREKTRLIQHYKNKCMDINHINELLREVTNLYIAKGYITTRAYIPPQNLKSGTLKIVIIEGTTDKIILNENSLHDRMQLSTAFPWLTGRILNLRDLEQGLDQMNRLPSNRATLRLLPGKKVGGTDVVITNKPYGRTRFTATLDNSGSDATGRLQQRYLLEQDNLLSLNDLWLFSYNKDVYETTTPDNKGKSYSGSLSIPLGYWTFSAGASRSEYLTFIRGLNQHFAFSGNTTTFYGSIARTLFRTQRTITTLNVTLSRKDTRSFIEDALIEPSSQKLAPLKIALEYLLRAGGGVWNFDLAYIRGLNWLGAREDKRILTLDEPKAQFNKLYAQISLYQPFDISKVPFIYRGKVVGQYSPDTLFGIERIVIGDQYTVRGFQDDSLQADSGAFMRNTLYYPVPLFGTHKTLNNLFGNLQLFAGLDGGFTASNFSSDGGFISSWAVGVSNYSRWLHFRVMYAQPITAPTLLEKRHHGVVYFSVSLPLKFF